MASKTYFHKGYFNGIDAVMLSGRKPKEVINDIEKGVGCFYTCSDECADETDLLEDGGKKTGKYIVVDSVSERCNRTPLDLLMNEDLSDEFVDVWEICND